MQGMENSLKNNEEHKGKIIEISKITVLFDCNF